MSIVWMEGFDSHGNDVFPLDGPDVQRYDNISGSAAAGGDVNFDPTGGKFDTGQLQLTIGGIGGDLYVAMPTHVGSLIESYVSFWFRTAEDTNSAGNILSLMEGQHRGTRQLLLDIDTGRFRLWDSSTIERGTTPTNVNTWYHLELYSALSTGSTGSVILKVNSKTELRSTGISIGNGGAGPAWDTLLLEHPDSAGRDQRYDDLVVQDGAGDWIGPHRIYTHLVDADISTGWTPSSTSSTNNYTMVDDSTGPDHDATYVSAASTGLRDEYGINDVSAVGDVLAINVKCLSDKTAIAPVQINIGIKSSTSEALGRRDVWGLSTVGYTENALVIETDPNTTGLAWTNASVKAASVVLDRIQ